ncbi:Acetoin:2,6-dichlorophenolindophenol oxidoreductase subunit alpha [subsurface metagenome]
MSHYKLPKEQLVEMYRKMVRIRKFELKLNELFLRGLIPGTIHLCHGQEAVAVGTVSCLNKRDKIMLTHRPHGAAIAKGLDPKKMMAEILGKSDGCTKGKGGSMHIVDVVNGVMPSIPIIGAGIPIGAGIAFAFQQKQTQQVVMSFFGDATTNIGAFHEGLNLAAIWKLPIVYICENNLYGVSTCIKQTSLVENLSERASAYGIPGVTVDGNDVELVYAAVNITVRRARQGGGSTLVECKTYRHGGHSRTDPGIYRPKEEVKEWMKRDPLTKCQQVIIDRGYLNESECNELEKREDIFINEVANFAVASPNPEPAEALKDVLAI